MTITDEMLNNAHRAYHGIPLLPDDEITDFDRERMRSAIAVALAVMPAPTDAEFEAAVDELLAAQKRTLFGPRWVEYEERRRDEFSAARRTLLAMHAQAKQQGLRKLRSAIEHEKSFWEGVREREIHETYRQRASGKADILYVLNAKIDAMLGSEDA